MRKRCATWLAVVASVVLAGPALADDVIVFSSNRSGTPASIFSVRLDGTGLTDLTPDTGGIETAPSISPDGKWVAYVMQRNGVWKMKLDGSQRTQLTTMDTSHLTTDWGDPNEILFNNWNFCGEDVYGIPANAAGTPHLVIDAGSVTTFPGPVAVSVARSVMGELAVVGTHCGYGGDLYLRDASGSYGLFWQGASHVDWSPDGTRVAVQLEAPDGSLNIWTGKRDGTDRRQLTTGGRNSDPSWSPDGEHIVFTRSNGPGQGSTIWYMSAADGSNPTPLTTGNGFDDNKPVWAQPDSPPVAVCRRILLQAGQACAASITTADVDGGSHDPDGDDFTLSLDSAGPFPPGTHTVRLTALDSSGSSSFCTAEVEVVDGTPPLAQLAQATCVNSPHGSGANLANLVLVSSSDNCSASSVAIDSVQILNAAGHVVHGSGGVVRSDSSILVDPSGGGWSVSLTLTSSDASGNISTTTLTQPLADCRPPGAQ